MRGNVDLMRAEGGGAKVGARFEGPYALRYVFVWLAWRRAGGRKGRGVYSANTLLFSRKIVVRIEGGRARGGGANAKRPFETCDPLTCNRVSSVLPD